MLVKSTQNFTLYILIYCSLLIAIFFTNSTVAQDQLIDKKSPIQSTQDPGLAVKITIEGLNKEEKKNTLAYLDIEKNRTSPRLNELWLKQLHSKAKKNIEQSLHAFGYYQVLIETMLKKDLDGIWQATYTIQTGKKVKYTSVKVKVSGAGSKEAEVISAEKNFGIKVGDFLDHELYEKSKTDLLILITDLGYADAKYEKKQLLVDPEKNIVDLILHISTGEKYYLGDFIFHQQSEQQLEQEFFKLEFINKYLVDVKKGESYSQKNLLIIQQSLVSSGFFSYVDVDPEFEKSEDHIVPIDITLSPVKKNKYSFGLAYDTEIDFNASARWQNRLINSSGHNSDVLLNLSQRKNKIQGTYWIPINDPRTDKIGLIAKLEDEDTGGTYRNTFDAELNYVFKWHDLNTKIFTEYKYEQYQYSIYDLETSLLSLGARIEGNFIEKEPYPRRGWSFYTELRGTPGKLISETNYLRLHVKSRVIFPVFDKGRLILRGEVGAANVNDIKEYPNSLRFFAGGDQSVRGYNWKTLGPTDLDGDVIGGTNVITGSIEYNHKIKPDWLIAGFFDAGNAFDVKYEKLYYGAGIGVRWISPVGLVRLDMGFPLNGDDNVDNLQSTVIYFGFEVSL